MYRICTQTYGLSREFEKDLTGTIEKLHRIGFCGIEPFVVFQETAGRGWTLDTLRKAARTMREYGMEIPSVHIGVAYGWFSMPLSSIAKNILLLQREFGVDTVVLSAPFGSVPLAKHWGKLMKKISDAVRPYGCRVLYHNHDDEFRRVMIRGAETELMEIFLDRTSPDVDLELDIGWAGFAGDEADIIRRYADRITHLHLKDFFSGCKDGQIRRADLPAGAFAPIGEGVIRTREILGMLDQLPRFSGALIVDQDQCAGDMITALTTGCRTVRALLGE